MTFKTSDRQWKILAGEEQFKSSASSTIPGSIPTPILAILANRGITSQEEIERFLSPSLDMLPSPQLLLGMEQAVNILVEARKSRTPVMIHGDYDADGVTATALLAKFFQEIDLPVYYHLPDRFSQGYGLSLDSLANLRKYPGIAEHPSPILLTVDCGITNIKEVEAAKALGFRIIITDHHHTGHELPDAEAIINPHQAGCAFPFRELAGVGVAFYLAAGLRTELVRQGVWTKKDQPNLKKYLDLVAIGSIADMVELRGTNRVLVKIGIEVINHQPRPGVKALLEQVGQGQGRVTSETIAFQLAPRLNAAGRTGSAEEALLLLIEDDEFSARNLAQSLDKANQLRKELTERMYDEARYLALKQIEEGCLVLMVSDDDWHQGIAGLVAAKLAREFSRPAVVLVPDAEGMAKGSVRSVGGINILACLQECSTCLDKFGGHRAAAGVTLKSVDVEKFHARLVESVARTIAPTDLESRLEIDLTANPGEIMKEAILNYLQLLGPFGSGNPEPIFCSRTEGVILSEAKKVGSDSLRFKILDMGQWINGVGFGLSEWAEVVEKEPVRLAYKLILNNFRGVANWEIRLEDIRIVS